LLDLINDILDLSKVEAGRIEIDCKEVNVQRLVGECLTAVSPLVKEGVELHQDLGDVDVLYTDSDRLKRALVNLLSNAVKYTREGRITVAVEAKGDLVEMRVCDTGDGIPTKELPFIFDEFRQVARKGEIALEGTGLGLAIVRRSAQLLGGGVRVESCEGEGTTFTLVLPNE
jgi:signal transduction histidine kinase